GARSEGARSEGARGCSRANPVSEREGFSRAGAAMMRLPYFRFEAPRTVQEAAELLVSGDAMLVAGGTDLLPNMKRRQQVPRTLVGLRRVAELRGISNRRSPERLALQRDEDGLTIGAGVTLSELVKDNRVREQYAGLWQAASQVATPHLRNMGTIGGNLCLDT